jgi:hypothetical protein
MKPIGSALILFVCVTAVARAGGPSRDTARDDRRSEYCNAGAYYCDEYISRVDLAAMSNATGCGLGSDGIPGYSNYTAMTVELQVGETYTITVTNGHPTWTTDACGAWIDWNDDLVFADPGEFYLMGTGLGPYSTNITVPNAPGPHRLRIRIEYADYPDPCGVHLYGEVEDYTVNIGGGFERGDVNCDGLVNAFDIDPFVQCLVHGTPTPPCPDCTTADTNQDGILNPFDIDPFVECIVNHGCHP